ncbi:DnaJ domain-containing protein [Crocosphaera sp. XPORK-15E]|uniref:DnaJ domain-containing protein n=1 Tax=Crocosphaera sp. XPORK-15E TaxID=3110247 RepID=UPI002B20A935|nr:DnaJ domain-containing protein [Crocosphaera sp. XPORK-15E]MEA5534192.1 DnaJ domain-containing protein [Crocosphaera sp. XPORK-15E]
MTNNLEQSIGFIWTGAVTGASIYSTIGGIGLVGGFGGIGLGLGTMTTMGIITGSAIYSGLNAVEEGDTIALSSIGLGVVSGISLSAMVGGMGLSFGGTAIGIGMGTMAVTGGVIGLGIYGLTKPFLDINNENKYYENIQFLEDITREYEQEQIWREFESKDSIEEEFKKLKEEVSSSTKNQENNAENSQNSAGKIPENNPKENQSETVTWKCTKIIHEHTAVINSIAISSDNHWLVSGSSDRTVKLYNLNQKNHVYTFFGLTAEVQSVIISPDNKLLVTGDFDNNISAWNLQDKTLNSALSKSRYSFGHKGAIFSLDFTSDRKYLVSSSGDHTLRLWNGYNGNFERTFNGHSDIVWSISINSNAQIIASGSADKTIRLWHFNHSQALAILTGHLGSVNTIKISPDGQYLVSGSTDKTIKLWQLSTGELIDTLIGHTEGVLGLTMTPDGNILASGSHQEVILWHLPSRKKLETLKGSHPILFSNDGKLLISGGSKGTLKIWTQESKYNSILSTEWWEILNVRQNADADQVKSSYHQLARQYHPDLNSSPEAIQKMQIINQAYEQFLNLMF